VRARVREDILRELDDPMLRQALQQVAGFRLLLPSGMALWPNREFLLERFDRFRVA
jgi:hypothetical protein